MRRSLLAVVAALSCAPLAPPRGNCGVTVGGNIDSRFKSDGLTDAIAQEMLDRALRATSLTTDPQLLYPEDLCRNLVGYSIYTKPPVGPFLLDGQRVMGYTECWFKMIVVAAPADGNWAHSPLIHEYFHAFQKCHAPLPVDTGQSKDHSNWSRDGINDAIQTEMNKPWTP
jgi:hypothetical protein